MKQLIWLDNKKIDISGPKGNAWVILGIASSCLKQCGIAKSEIDAFNKEAKSNGYDHLCKTVTEVTGIQLVDGSEMSDWL